MRRAGLVSGVRGPGGGYRLARASHGHDGGRDHRRGERADQSHALRGRLAQELHRPRAGAASPTGSGQEMGDRIQGFLASVSLADVLEQRFDGRRARGRGIGMMTKTPVYCDYNAGAPIRAEAAVAMSRALARRAAIPLPCTASARRVRALIEDAREQVAAALDATRGERRVHVGRDGGAASGARRGARRSHQLIISAVEHDAVFEHATRALRADRSRAGRRATASSISTRLRRLLAAAPKPALVAVQLANNETGVIQPIAQVAALCAKHGALLLVDAAQAFGRIPVEHRRSRREPISSSPATSSAARQAPARLCLRRARRSRTTRFGGGQERGRRPGTENGAAIVGFGAAVEWALRERERGSRARRGAARPLRSGACRGGRVVFGKAARAASAEYVEFRAAGPERRDRRHRHGSRRRGGQLGRGVLVRQGAHRAACSRRWALRRDLAKARAARELRA